MSLYFYITGVHRNINVCVLLILEIYATACDGQLMLVSSSMIIASLQKTEESKLTLGLLLQADVKGELVVAGAAGEAGQVPGQQQGQALDWNV